MTRIEQTIIRAGTAQAFRLASGDRIKIITPEGGQVADATFAGFHQALTRRINGTRINGRVSVIDRASQGVIFYDGLPSPVLELVENNSAAPHDLLFPGCQCSTPGGKPGCRDLLSAVLDLTLMELPAPCSFFMNIDNFFSVPSLARPGDYVVLEAKRAVRFGVTACPGPTSNDRHGPIHVEVHIG